MANYRFNTAEIEAMKKNILTHIEHETDTKTAWRLRCAIEGQLMCCRPSKREAARLRRELALYEKLTKSDLPNWQGGPTQGATPTETPQISTEAAETVKLSAEVTKTEKTPKYSISERDGNVCVTFMRGVIRECAKRCGVSCKSAEWNTIAQAYNGIHSDMGMGLSFFFDGREDAVRFAELVCNGDISGYYKFYMDKIIAEGEARKKRIAEECAEYDAAQAHFAECMANEAAETVNVSAEGEKAAERADIEQNHSDTRIVEDEYRHKYKVTRHWLNGRIESIEVWDLDHTSEPPQSPENRPTAADVVQMVKTELAKNKAMGTAWHLEFPDGTECDVRHKCTAAGCDFYEYTEVREGEETFKDYKATERDITLYICQLLDLDAPQSPGTPQTV